MTLQHLFFSTDGRISRIDFVVGALFLVSCTAILFFILYPVAAIIIFPRLSEPGFWHTQEGSRELWMITVVGLVIVFVPVLSLVAKRLHDRNKTAWLAAVLVLPVILDILIDFTGAAEASLNPLKLLTLCGYSIVAIWVFIDLCCL